jgi:hypothetical protein
MASFRLISENELADLAVVLQKHGWRTQDFELQEDVFDPRRAEVEACAGEVGVRCLATDAIEIYRLGAGFMWVDDFAHDLERGRFDSSPET